MQFATTGGTADKFELSVAGPVSVQHGVHFAHRHDDKESECAYGMHVLSQVHVLTSGNSTTRFYIVEMF